MWRKSRLAVATVAPFLWIEWDLKARMLTHLQAPARYRSFSGRFVIDKFKDIDHSFDRGKDCDKVESRDMSCISVHDEM